MRRLISIRQSHSALQSRGEIEFVYAGKNAYPFAYLRSDGREKILVVLNPSDKAAAFECEYIPQAVLYSFGGEATVSGGKFILAPQSAGYFIV